MNAMHSAALLCAVTSACLGAGVATNTVHAKLAEEVCRVLEATHTSRHAPDDVISRRAFTNLLEMCDGRHMVFLADDIAEFAKSQDKLDDFFKAGDFSFARRVRRKYRERLKECTTFATNALARAQRPAGNPSTYLFDRSKEPWPNNADARNAIWLTRLASETIFRPAASLSRAYVDALEAEMKRGEDVEDLSKIDAIMGIEREETGDFIVNEKDKLVNLTAEGVAKVERFFRIENLADPENLEIQHCIILALRAHNLMHRDHDYIVKDDQVLIVDEFTGRVMPGRRYSDGLHQAIEAKEHVKVKRESRTLATITFQNFFNKFDKKCGMTGTALTEEREFREIYGMDVIEIPTNRPVIRFDDQDAVYKTKKEKFRAVVNAVKEAYEKGQPVLVGTITIQVSEEVSKMLKKAGIPHNVLNAKFHEMEAEIVAEAGRHGAVTIATNMAGRGTDIKLDEEARAAGGLKIIGTERHESRRIDNQLRGRSGRQGDPGESRFYISLEDDLMRLFGSDRMTAMFNALNIPEDQEITHKSLSKAIEGAQKKIENNNFGIRKNLLDYDQVMNEQREIIYAQRREVLDGKSMRDSVFNMITDFVDSTVDTCISDDIDSDDWNLTELNELLLPTIPLQVVTRGRIRERTRDGLKQQLKEEAVALYESKEAEFPEAEAVRELERVVILKVVDRKWMDHIDDMEQLRQSIGLQAYGQHDPLVEYKMAGYDMFNEMTRNIMEETVRVLFHVKVEQKVEREEVAKATGTNKDDTAVKQPKRRTDKKIYPNDPCPCGSGKKYKNCHGRPGMSL